MPPSARELLAAIAAEAEDLEPLIMWHMQSIAVPSEHSLRHVVADAFMIALHELGALHMTRSVAEIRIPGGSPVHEHMHAHLAPGTILAAAAAFQRACGGPDLIGRTLHDWETRGTWTYARTEPRVHGDGAL